MNHLGTFKEYLIDKIQLLAQILNPNKNHHKIQQKEEKIIK